MKAVCKVAPQPEGWGLGWAEVLATIRVGSGSSLGAPRRRTVVLVKAVGLVAPLLLSPKSGLAGEGPDGQRVKASIQVVSSPKVPTFRYKTYRGIQSSPISVFRWRAHNTELVQNHLGATTDTWVIAGRHSLPVGSSTLLGSTVRVTGFLPVGSYTLLLRPWAL